MRDFSGLTLLLSRILVIQREESPPGDAVSRYGAVPIDRRDHGIVDANAGNERAFVLGAQITDFGKQGRDVDPAFFCQLVRRIGRLDAHPSFARDTVSRRRRVEYGEVPICCGTAAVRRQVALFWNVETDRNVGDGAARAVLHVDAHQRLISRSGFDRVGNDLYGHDDAEDFKRRAGR